MKFTLPPSGVTVQSGSGWLTEIGVAVSSAPPGPVPPGTPSGSVMVVNSCVGRSSRSTRVAVPFTPPPTSTLVAERATQILVGMALGPVVSTPRLYPATRMAAGISPTMVAPERVTSPEPSVCGFGAAVPLSVHWMSAQLPFALFWQVFMVARVPGAAWTAPVAVPMATTPARRPAIAATAPLRLVVDCKRITPWFDVGGSDVRH